MNSGRLRVWSSAVLAVSLGAAVNGCGGDDDSSGSSGGHSATGGSSARGGASGKSGASGATGVSGHAGVGGSSSGAGGAGGSSGSVGSGGVSGTGAAGAGTSSGGALAAGGMAGTGTGGSTALGGMGGALAMAGSGGMAPSYCYESLYAPIMAEGDQTDFEVDYGASAAIDMSGTTLSVRLRTETAGNAGGVQVYVKDGATQNYATAYLGWNNITDLESFTTLTYDLSQASGGTGFDLTAIRYVGINVATGNTWDGADFEPTTVYVDSITFSDGASADMNFNDGVNLLQINTYNSPVAGSAVSAGICQVETGTGGMGGMSGSAGTTGGGGQTSTGGTTGNEGGEAGLGGEGGIIEPGTGGSSTGTGGTAGSDTGGTSGGGGTSGAAGTSGGGAGGVSGGGGTSGAAGTSGGAGASGASGHAGAAGSSGGSTNLITNGTFESGATTGWSSWGTGTFQVSSTAHTGNYSMLVTGRTGSNINILTNVSSVVSTGHTYAVSAWMRTSAATSAHFTAQITCANSTTSYPWLDNPATNVDNTAWTQITGTLDLSTVCAGSTLSSVNVYLEGMATGVDVYVDDVSMTQN